ncbi:MAG: hypothetical protein MPN21_00845 [Thermoanaerobaculia bacterium]|nr:hypothetical protein [Thermoanaerobaculia bacterium]
MLRFFQNPSLRFFAVLVLAPVLAIIGEAFGGFRSPAGLTGLLLTLTAISFAGFLSYRHERARLPKANLILQITGKNSILVRYLVGVAVLCSILVSAAIVVAVALVVRLIS